MSLEAIGAFLGVYAVPVALAVVVLLSGAVGWLVSAQKRTASLTVAAVYRRAIEIARGIQRERLTWLLSAEGVAKRKALVEEAYDALPPVVVFGRLTLPIGAAKLFISKEQFVRAVEAAFVEMVELADRLDGPNDE